MSVSLRSARRAAVGVVGIGVLAGSMLFGALPFAQAAPPATTAPTHDTHDGSAGGSSGWSGNVRGPLHTSGGASTGGTGNLSDQGGRVSTGTSGGFTGPFGTSGGASGGMQGGFRHSAVLSRHVKIGSGALSAAADFFTRARLT